MKIKAMILAAGLGSRLKPITNTIPKPLIKIGKETILERHLRNLQKARINDVVINVSYLAEKIMKEVMVVSSLSLSSHQPCNVFQMN